MSASRTPTVSPLVAREAARFTVTEDFPTPPFPDATAMTFVVGEISVVGASWVALQRARAIVVAFSSGVISVQESSRALTPGSEPTRARMSLWIWARRGQPAVVSATVTVTAPPSETSIARTMPSSTMSAPSSGSITPSSRWRTCPSVGRASRSEVIVVILTGLAV